MDVFIEPVFPRPQLVICGSSPVAVAIADLGRRIGFEILICAPLAEQSAFPESDQRIDGYALPSAGGRGRFIVVSTQGRGDETALEAALSAESDYIAFVGSRRKAEALKSALAARGVDSARLRAPAGLDIGAIAPEEIALSILAEIVAARRHRHPRGAAAG
jgi:xanthine dehydrogenase accessory factor